MTKQLIYQVAFVVVVFSLHSCRCKETFFSFSFKKKNFSKSRQRWHQKRTMLFSLGVIYAYAEDGLPVVLRLYSERPHGIGGVTDKIFILTSKEEVRNLLSICNVEEKVSFCRSFSF